jgi:hypothetical protein
LSLRKRPQWRNPKIVHDDDEKNDTNYKLLNSDVVILPFAFQNPEVIFLE